jgi:hypothetical protein
MIIDKYILFAIGCSALFLSCLNCKRSNNLEDILKSKIEYDTSDLRTIFPVGKGFTWYYEKPVGSDIIHDGKPLYSNNDKITTQIYAFKDTNEHRYIELVETLEDTKQRYQMIINRKECVIIDDHFNVREVILKTPIKKNNRWSVYGESNTDEFYYYISTPDTTINIRNHTYNHAIHVKSHAPFGSKEYFIVPGIGIVMDFSMLITGSKQELVDLNFNNNN